ncbi:MAG: hypothetical protein JEZ03_03270 [Bacteroidales bacterium]|nr:hypothetical protein [Bacteroidales bacterium]
MPILRYFKWIPGITYEEVALRIGIELKEVDDKILNIIQLEQNAQLDKNHLDLILAGIDQKIEIIKPYQFKTLISLNSNRKYLKYLIPWVVVIVSIGLFSPGMISEPTSRYLKHLQQFEKPRDYSVEIVNNDFTVVEGDDYTVRVLVSGENLPDILQIQIDKKQIYYLNQVNSNKFEYTIKNNRKNFVFRVLGNEYTSDEFRVKLLAKPIISDFSITLTPPAYSGLDEIVFSNRDHFEILKGTIVNWDFYVSNVSELKFIFTDTSLLLSPRDLNKISLSKQIYATSNFTVVISNEFVSSNDSIVFEIEVVRDLFPSVFVNQFQDSLNFNFRYFSGKIEDDFGFDKLLFNYGKIDTKIFQKENIGIDPVQNPQIFHSVFDIEKSGFEKGDELECYFEIFDNDMVSGPKSTKSASFIISIPSDQDLDSIVDSTNENLKTEMENLLKMNSKIDEELKKLKNRILTEGSISWEDEEKIRQLIDDKQNVADKLENIKNEFEHNNDFEENINEFADDILEKQKLLEQLMDELLDEETLKLIEDLRQEMENLDKDKMLEMLEKMESSNEDVEKALDRNLELFKQLEFDKKLSEIGNALDSLAKSQDSLSKKKTDENPLDQIKEQKELKDELQRTSENIEKLEKLNDELMQKESIPDVDDLMEQTLEDMNRSMQQMQSGDSEKSQKSQKSASQKTKEMSNIFGELKQKREEQNAGEDISTIKGILSDLIVMSYSEETLIQVSNQLSYNNPLYLQLSIDQNKIKSQFDVVQDSLLALSKRQPIIKSKILKEINLINKSFSAVVDLLEARDKSKAMAEQQYVMTGINNLALMLSESLDQMQQNMNMKGGGNGDSKNQKPSSGEQGMKSLKQMQEQMKQQLEQLQQGMKSQSGKSDTKQMGESFVRMAARQAAIRRKLEQYKNSLEKEGLMNNQGIQKAMDMMDQNENDLLNKNINVGTIRRQQQIQQRLMEAERAEMQRGKEEKREAETSDKIKAIDSGLELWKSIDDEKLREEIRRKLPDLKLYYQKLYDKYLIEIEED